MTNDKYLRNEATDHIDEIFRRNQTLEKRVLDLERALRNQDAPAPLPRIDPVTYPNPYEGQRAIDPADEQHMWYSDSMWRKAAAGGLAIYEIKVFEDTEVITTGDNKFEWEIPEDLDAATLAKVEIFVSTVSSSGIVQVQIANEKAAGGTVDMLSTRVQIDANELNSKTAATAYVIDTSNDEVLWGDHLRIDVDVAGTGAKGLGAILTFVASATATMILRGVANWLGQWTTSTSYSKGDAVTNDGSSYVAIVDHTSGASSEPGTGANWQTYWMVLAAGSGGGGYTNYETRSSVTQLGSTDAGKIIDLTATMTQTFDTDDNLGDGWWVVLRNATDDGTTIITLDPAGSETIDGIATPKMYSGETRLIFCNGAGGNFNSVLLEGGFARFTSTGAGSFQVPHGITQLFVDCIGGGGGGGGQSNHGPSDWPGGSGGGGGARAQRIIPAEQFTSGSTISLTVGTGGTGGSNADGSAGGNSSFGSSPTFVLACGGGGGGGGSSAATSGGGGGGTGAAGGTDNGTGGMNSANATGIGGQGGGSQTSFGATGKQAEWGGGGGGAAHNNGTGGAGGSSLHGGGGGGGGGGSELDSGGAGGGTAAWTTGGGGAGGTSGGNGANGASGDIGAGGGGGSGNSSGSSGGAGGTGGVPGGGGGGSAVLNSNTPAGGNGGRGEVRVYYS